MGAMESLPGGLLGDGHSWVAQEEAPTNSQSAVIPQTARVGSDLTELLVTSLIRLQQVSLEYAELTSRIHAWSM